MPEVRQCDSVRCELPARLELIAEVSRRLKAYCQRRLLDMTEWAPIDLLLAEALTNAIKHGCQEDSDATVMVSWSWEDEVLTIEVEDPGIGTFQQPVELPADPSSESGRGLFILHSLADKVEHFQTQDGHRLVLKKQLHPPGELLLRSEEMFTTLQATTAELSHTHARLSCLEGFAQDLSENPSIEGILGKGASRIRDIVSIEEIQVWTSLQGGFQLEYTDSGGKTKKGKLAFADTEAEGIASSFRDRRPLLLSDLSAPLWNDEEYPSERCALIQPILFQREVLGVVCLLCPKSELDGMERQLGPHAETFARFLGIAFASAAAFSQRREQERSRTQLEIAAEIQKSLLPSSYPSNNYCRMTGRCVAAMEVGGDYFDAIEIRDTGLFLVIADVMGKGVPAALLATIFRTAIRSRLNLAETPGWMLAKINGQIHQELGHLDMFITAQAAFFSYEQKRLKLASAGHCPALLLNSGTGGAEEITAEGLPLGIGPGDLYEERIYQLEEGDRVLFITDGLYEVEDRSGQAIGLNGLSARLPEIWHRGVESVPTVVFDLISQHSGGLAPNDDRTLMALEVL